MIGRRRGGDGQPPDQTVEVNRIPEVGNIYKFNKKGAKGFDYVRVEEILPPSRENKGKARIILKKWDGKRWVKGIFSQNMLLESFLGKNDKHNYSFGFNTPQEFYDDQNIPVQDRPVEPIRAFKDLGPEGLPPEEAEDQGRQEEELELTELAPDKQDEPPEDGDEITVGEEEIIEPEEAESQEEPNREIAIKDDPTKPEVSKEESEFETRLGLNESELEERRALAEEVAIKRKLYVQQDFEHNKALKRILSVVKITEKPEIDPRYLEAYKESLRKLREFDVFKLQTKIREIRPDSEEQKQDIQSYVARYSKVEAAALWSAREELRIEKSEEWSKKYLGERVSNATNKAFDWYRNLSLPKKLAIGGAALGLQAAATFAVGPAAGIGYLAFRSFTAAAGYKAAKGAVEGISQKTMDTWRDNRFKGESKNLNSLRIATEEGKVSQADFFRALQKISQDSIDNIDKKLEQRKRQSTFAKATTAAVMFGMPVARYLGMFDSAVGGRPNPTNVTEISNEAAPAGPIETPTPPLEGEAPRVPSGPERVDQPFAGTTETLEGSTSSPDITPSTEIRLESVTITEEHQARGLWGILDSRLPENMPEAERNRVISSMQALINTKLQGLTDAQIREQYGFSSRDINLIHPGEVIHLERLISQEEYQNILNSRETLSISNGETLQPGIPNPETTGGGTQSFPEAREAQGYINSDVIGFSGPEAPRHPDEAYWQSVRDVQGRATGPQYASYIPGNEGPNRLSDIPGYDPQTGAITEGALNESNAGSPEGYTVEMSDYRALLQDPIAEGRNIPVLQRESMNFIQQELWDIDNTEFGPDHQFTNMNMRPIEQQYAGRPMTELLAFDTERYNYDPRVQYREYEWERRTGRGIYLPPVNPGPTLESGPDAYANTTMDQVQNEYRRNIGRMAEAAMQAFGNAALPINTPEHQETVREYTLRIATLYTRARIENPNFRLNF